MKPTLRWLIPLLLVPAIATAQTSAPRTRPRPAVTLVSEGVARAAREHKILMVEFSASWCGWCHKYEKFLADSTAGVGQIMRDNFVIVQVIVQENGEKQALNNPGSDSLLAAYAGTRASGIPFYAFLDATGKVLGTANAMPDGSNIGHPAVEEEFEAYDKLLGRVAPNITAAQRSRIRSYLRDMSKG